MQVRLSRWYPSPFNANASRPLRPALASAASSPGVIHAPRLRSARRHHAAAAPAAATPSSDLAHVIADHWQWALDNDPFLATEVGDHRGDGKLPDASLAAADRAAATEQGFIARLDAIAAAGLTPAERTNRGVLRRMLADDVEGNRFGQRAITFTTYSGWHTALPAIPTRRRCGPRRITTAIWAASPPIRRTTGRKLR